jgi:hypothetical protein
MWHGQRKSIVCPEYAVPDVGRVLPLMMSIIVVLLAFLQ